MAESIVLCNDGLRFDRGWLKQLDCVMMGCAFDRGWLEQIGSVVFRVMGCFVIRVQGVMSCGVRMSIRTPILPLHSPHLSIPLHIAMPRFISSSLLSSSSTTTSILSRMSSAQFQNGSQVGVPFLGLCLKLANLGMP